jgi:hypothetical protein
MSFKGIDVRATGDRIVVRALLLDSSGAKVTTGSASLYLYELQQDGSLKSFDFRDKMFKTVACAQETLALAHQTGNGGGTNTGIWTAAFEVEQQLESSSSGESASSESSPADETPLTPGSVLIARVNHASASPAWQAREFQYGGDQGDLPMTYGEVDAASLEPTSSAFETTLTEDTDDAYNEGYIVFLTGSLAGQTGRVITDYQGTTANPNGKGKIVSLLSALTAAPAHGDKFVIVGASSA